ncbi:HD domain-containing protein [Rossellomorea aquimaris]|uniref:HD-GYP domain-containing protein n=1 Tax=Rossellomorea aquimaris TaxID=189382 RepID=UPI001CD68463|nr:HD-GYP domain-containing protein [Rossellomorea aquimaris]MCA1056432.1 HD domain-containing protein [Rossellomorea aquimaris]
MDILAQFQRKMIVSYLVGSFIAVFGVGSVFIFQTIPLKGSESMAMATVILLSILIMFSCEFFVYQKHIGPIRTIYKKETHDPGEMLVAYRQAEKFPLLTVKRIMIPHFLGLAVPATLLTLSFIRMKWLTIPGNYIVYAWCGAFLVASLHSLIEFFLASRACHPLQKDLIQKSVALTGTDPSKGSQQFVSLKKKLLAGSLFLALFPILLFSLASQIKLSMTQTDILEDYWRWAAFLVLIVTMLAFYGALLLFKSIDEPVQDLMGRFKEVEEGNISPLLNTHTDEFSYLFAGFNHMVEAIDLRDQKNQQLLDQFFAVIAGTLDARDPYTAGHSKRVAEFSVSIAKECGWSLGEMDLLRKSALLHDIGKIGIRDHVLLKEGKLTDEEFEQIKTHPVIGSDIVESVRLTPDLHPILPGIKHHHERYDGLGYPDQLKGNEIPVFGRLMAVADAFDAMTSDRPYRKGMPFHKAFAILEKGRGSQWDPVFVDAFFRAMGHTRENAAEKIV